MSTRLFGAAILVLVFGTPLTVLWVLEGEGRGESEAVVPAVEHDAAEQEVLSAVRELFDAIAHADTAAVRRVMLPQARLVVVDTETEPPGVRVSNRSEFMASLAGSSAHFLERMWNARVRIDGPMAMVWTPYDFHRDEEFSHCGVDVFDLIRGTDGWRIVSVTYTRHPPGRCGEKPA